MKIGKYTKLKSNKYSVEIDDMKVKLYDDVIVKYELLRVKEIDDKIFKEITEYNDKLEAYYKSLKYITKKLRTEKEIYKYLDKDYDKKTILETIEKLKNIGYLNKEVYLKCYISDQLNMSLVGPNKIKKDLISLGYSEEEIVSMIDDIDNDVNGISQDKHGRDRKLKEFLGHTPLEVLAGALLGILIAMIYPL